MPIAFRTWACIALAMSVALLASAATPRHGGHLVFGQEAGPPTLDPHFTTSVATRNVAMHIFEMLLTRDENNAVIKELAEDYAVDDSGLVYTFKLRSGIRFHDGRELTSADVLASFARYKRLAVGNALEPVASMHAPDPATFVIRLKSPVPPFIEEVSALPFRLRSCPPTRSTGPAARSIRLGRARTVSSSGCLTAISG
jgi:peptide/nickel transport system substrate-binding protein